MIEGGISKTRCATKLPAPDRTGTLPIQENKQNTMLSDTEQVNRDYSFADSSMSSAAAGVAGRLVMYSQKLVNSFGYVPSTGPGAFYFKLLFCLGIDWPAPMGHWSPLVHVRHLLPRTNKQARAWIKTPTYL